MKWKVKERKKRNTLEISNKNKKYIFNTGINGFNKYKDFTGKDFDYVINKIADETLTVVEQLEVIYSLSKSNMTYNDFSNELSLDETIEIFTNIIDYLIFYYKQYTSSFIKFKQSNYCLKRKLNNEYKKSGLL